jgi:UDP-N-acetylglucosamine--N-acetylmuramyl-(pentapeptide) pyrophosphoryl-undecaprenol N-acetylglucosamine transferase
VIHLCGKDKVNEDLKGMIGYVQFEYIQKELCDILAASDLVISRAGANVICELLALKKPNILIPLSREASRGDQILNARSFEQQGYSYVLEEEKLSDKSLLQAVKEVFRNKEKYITAMKNSEQQNSVKKIVDLLDEVSK